MSEPAELFLCDRCGGEARFGYYKNTVRAYCTKCGLSTSYHTMKHMKEKGYRRFAKDLHMLKHNVAWVWNYRPLEEDMYRKLVIANILLGMAVIALFVVVIRG